MTCLVAGMILAIVGLCIFLANGVGIWVTLACVVLALVVGSVTQWLMDMYQ